MAVVAGPHDVAVGHAGVRHVRGDHQLVRDPASARRLEAARRRRRISPASSPSPSAGSASTRSRRGSAAPTRPTSTSGCRSGATPGASSRDFWLTGTGLNTYGVATLVLPDGCARVPPARSAQRLPAAAAEGGCCCRAGRVRVAVFATDVRQPVPAVARVELLGPARCGDRHRRDRAAVDRRIQPADAWERGAVSRCSAGSRSIATRDSTGAASAVDQRAVR